MTFDEFKTDFFAFLKSSTVNLGRRTAKTRNKFLKDAAKKFDFYGGFNEDGFIEIINEVNDLQKLTANPVNDRVICIKPKSSRRGLNVGKGVSAMTPGESMRADEELGHSPFVDKIDKKE